MIFHATKRTYTLTFMTSLLMQIKTFSGTKLIPAEMIRSEYPTPRLLSIQSHTVHGFVGNKASTLPLQCFGFNVDAINTVTLSNHPGYAEGAKGQRLSPDVMEDIVGGLTANKLLNYDVVLTGYMPVSGVVETTVQLIDKLKSMNPNIVFVCDPVLGDLGRFYVPEELANMFRTRLLPFANVITPNQFEAEILSGIKINSLADAKAACTVFHRLGVKLCVLKGLQLPGDKYSIVISVYEAAAGKIACDEEATQTGEAETGSSPASKVAEDCVVLRVDIPHIKERHFSGCGDLFSSLFTGLLFRTYGSRERYTAAGVGTMLDHVSAVMLEVLQRTQARGSSELCIIESIDTFRKYSTWPVDQSANESSNESADKSSNFPPNDELPILQDSDHGSTAGAIGTRSLRRSYQSSFKPVSELIRPSYIVQGPLAGVIFDMDGTLTEAGAIDFAAMYSRAGLARGAGDILTQINALSDPARREEAHRIILEEEMKGVARMRVRADASPLIAALQRQRVRVALSTRNCEAAMEKFFETDAIFNERFYPALHRDSLEGINKPDRRVADHILQHWEADAEEGDRRRVWFVGDSEDDLACGRAAGCRTCLVRTEFNQGLPAQHPHLVDLVVDSLQEFGAAVGVTW